jgi:hypothetical protein
MCATHVRNCLKEPAKSKSVADTKMHIRVQKWEAGKRLKPGARAPEMCGLGAGGARSFGSRARPQIPPSHATRAARRDHREGRRGCCELRPEIYD